MIIYYSRILAQGPEGHVLAVSIEWCAFHVDGMWTSARDMGSV